MNEALVSSGTAVRPCFTGNRHRSHGLCLGFLAVTLSWSASVFAQQGHRGSPNALAADVVFLNDGSTFYGVIEEVSDNDVYLVLERDWLQATYPDVFREQQEREIAALQNAETVLIERIDQWIRERPQQTNLVLFLEDERQAAIRRQEAGLRETKRFMSVHLRREDIRRVVLQSPPQRRIALLAWKHKLREATTRTARDLQQELQQLGISNEERVDFQDEIPTSPQSDRQWALRKGVIEFVLMRPLEFQGTGDTFFRRGEQPALASVFQQLMSQGSSRGIQQIGEELGLPEFTRNRQAVPAAMNNDLAGDWWRKQAAIAEQEGLRVFSVTRLSQNASAGEVRVQVVLVARDESGNWQVVKECLATANANQQSDQDVQTLMQDPQVRQVLKWAEGLGDASAKQVQQALRHGVATQAAMQQGLTQLFQFTETYSKRTDRPALPLNK